MGYKKNKQNVNKVYLFGVLTTLLIGCIGEPSDDHSKTHDFSDVQIQQLSDRIIIGSLALKDSLLLSEKYGILNARGRMSIDSETLYILENPPLQKLFMIDKESLALLDTLSFSDGRGPGELSEIHGFDLSPDYIVLSDETISKVQIRNKDWELLNEFILENIYPFRIQLWNDGAFTFLSERSMETGSIFYTMDQDGNLLNSFGNVSGEPFNPIRFGGSILTEEEFLYYAGYSEHILGKWDREGELHYMVATIDDFPGETNLISSGSANVEQGMFGFVPGGFFSAFNVMIHGDLLIVVHAGYWEDDVSDGQFLDIYDKNSGQYKATVKLPWRSGGVEMDDEYIYALPRIDDERYLFIYENTLEELLGEEMTGE